MLPRWLIEILRCPETGQHFELVSGTLTRADGKVFPTHDDIISLVYPASLLGEDAKMNRLYEHIAPFYDFSERVLGWMLAVATVAESPRSTPWVGAA